MTKNKELVTVGPSAKSITSEPTNSILVSTLTVPEKSMLIQMLSNQNTIMRVLFQMLEDKITADRTAQLKKELNDCCNATANVQRPVYDALVKGLNNAAA